MTQTQLDDALDSVTFTADLERVGDPAHHPGAAANHGAGAARVEPGPVEP